LGWDEIGWDWTSEIGWNKMGWDEMDGRDNMSWDEMR